MPQILQYQDSIYHIGIWKIEEPEDYFTSRLELGLEQLPELTPERKLQSLAARHLLNLMLEKNLIVYKNEWNQPVLEDDHRYISISHTFDAAAVLVAHRACGIDIEKNLPRIERIAPKFLYDNEINQLQGSDYRSKLYRIWGSKECMFKAYGLGQIDFKKDLWVDLEAIQNNNKSFAGRLLNHPDEILFELNWLEFFPDYTLVYGSMV